MYCNIIWEASILEEVALAQPLMIYDENQEMKKSTGGEQKSKQYECCEREKLSIEMKKLIMMMKNQAQSINMGLLNEN